MNQINCRFCGGQSPSNGKRCLGCGMPVANAEKKSRTKSSRVKCPSCNKRNARELDNHGFVCLSCHVEFEGEDFSFVHCSPVVNAIRKGL